MNRFFSLLLVLCVGMTLSVPSGRAQQTDLLVKFPVPPDEMTRLDERCNYIVDNYWKHFNFKSAFSSKDRMEATLAQFLSVTPYASVDTVYAAIETLVRGVEKNDARNLLTLAGMAERLCATDSAEYASEDLMLPFAEAVANCKKLKGPEKEKYTLMAQRMRNSRVGVTPADFQFVVPDGTTGRFSDVTEPTVLLFFYDPNDFQSRLARTRLGSDFVIKTLINHGMLKVVAIYPHAPDNAWLEDVSAMPPGWIIGAAEGIGDYFSLRRNPQIYYLDEERKITSKDFSVDAALIYFSQFLQTGAQGGGSSK